MSEDEPATTTASTTTSTTTATATTSTTATATPAAKAAAAQSSHKTMVHWQEVSDTVSRLASHTGVLAVTILNAHGDIVTQHVTTAGAARTKDGASALGNTRHLTATMAAANCYVQSLGSNNSNASAPEQHDEDEPQTTNEQEEISFVRIRTQTDEILVAPKLGYTLVVLQDPNISPL